MCMNKVPRTACGAEGSWLELQHPGPTTFPYALTPSNISRGGPHSLQRELHNHVLVSIAAASLLLPCFRALNSPVTSRTEARQVRACSVKKETMIFSPKCVFFVSRKPKYGKLVPHSLQSSSYIQSLYFTSSTLMPIEFW